MRCRVSHLFHPWASLWSYNALLLPAQKHRVHTSKSSPNRLAERRRWELEYLCAWSSGQLRRKLEPDPEKLLATYSPSAPSDIGLICRQPRKAPTARVATSLLTQRKHLCGCQNDSRATAP